MTESAAISDLQTKQATVAARVDSQEKHLDRLDVSVEKLTEVSISLKEIVKNQEQKHDAAVETHKDIYRILDDRRIYNDQMFNALKTSLDTTKNEFGNLINDMKVDVATKIESLETTIEEKSAVLDKYKWVIVGGGFVVMFLIDKGPTLLQMFSGG